MSSLTSALRLRADGQPNTDLARASRDGVADHAVDAEHGQREREPGEERERHRAQPRGKQHCGKMARHRLHLNRHQAGVDLAQRREHLRRRRDRRRRSCARRSSAIAENSCANDVMMNGRGSSPSERTFVVRVMPTTRYTLESVLNVWPIASLPGQNCRAIASLMTATRGAPRPSAAVIPRPRITDTPIAPRNPESAAAKSTSNAVLALRRRDAGHANALCTAG